MYYVRTSGGSMMPVYFKGELLVTDKKQATKVEIKTSKKQKKTQFFDHLK